jgi:aryl-phospho-beta-D-glucosidase BglC (GH1 family)
LEEKIFQTKYKKNLKEWIDLDPVFSRLKALGINAVRIPIPVEALIPHTGGKIDYSDEYHMMIMCYQDAIPYLHKVYEMASKYRIAVYLAITLP